MAALFATPLTIEGCQATIRRHVEQRDALFLAMVRDRAFAPGSPHRVLFDLARCEYRDVEIMVRQRGIEPTLDALRRAGVYLSFEEFKNGAEVRRDGHVLRFTAGQFDSSGGGGGITRRSGGTRSAGTWVFMPLVRVGVSGTRRDAPRM